MYHQTHTAVAVHTIPLKFLAINHIYAVRRTKKKNTKNFKFSYATQMKNSIDTLMINVLPFKMMSNLLFVTIDKRQKDSNTLTTFDYYLIRYINQFFFLFHINGNTECDRNTMEFL